LSCSSKSKKGGRFLLWTKIGGEQHLATVMALSNPYPKGKKSTYIDVFGVGVRKSVNVLKLRVTKDDN